MKCLDLNPGHFTLQTAFLTNFLHYLDNLFMVPRISVSFSIFDSVLVLDSLHLWTRSLFLILLFCAHSNVIISLTLSITVAQFLLLLRIIKLTRTTGIQAVQGFSSKLRWKFSVCNSTAEFFVKVDSWRNKFKSFS